MSEEVDYDEATGIMTPAASFFTSKRYQAREDWIGLDYYRVGT